MEEKEKLLNSRGKEIAAKKYYQPANTTRDIIQLILVVLLSFLPVIGNIYLFKNEKPEIKIITPAPNNNLSIDLTEEEKSFSKRFGQFWEESQKKEAAQVAKEKKEDDKPWRRKH